MIVSIFSLLAAKYKRRSVFVLKVDFLFKINFLIFSDLVACAAPIGIFFGRIANFINGELFGRITESNLGIIFPHIDKQLRHPSQIYEALFEGLLLFIILF